MNNRLNTLSDCNSIKDLNQLIGEDEITEEEYQDMVSYIQDKISGNKSNDQSILVEDN
jgi:hypothetical protein